MFCPPNGNIRAQLSLAYVPQRHNVNLCLRWEPFCCRQLGGGHTALCCAEQAAPINC